MVWGTWKLSVALCHQHNYQANSWLGKFNSTIKIPIICGKLVNKDYIVKHINHDIVKAVFSFLWY